MTLEIDHEWPEKLLRGWAKAYRDSPEYRFPSDPSAEFFPVDMENAANEIERLRGALKEIVQKGGQDLCRGIAAEALRGVGQET